MNDVTGERIRYGYTLGDLDRLARSSVGTAWARGVDYRDRYDTAWHAIAELLYSAAGRPTRHDLKVAGTTAVNQLGQDEARHHGFDRHNPDAGAEGRPRFQRYWTLLGRATPSHEDRVVDRLALVQIWPALSRTHQRTLLALAVHDDHALAAAAIDRDNTTYRAHLKNARVAYRALWHEGESPSRMWGRSMGSLAGRRTATQVLAHRRHQRIRAAVRAERAA